MLEAKKPDQSVDPEVLFHRTGWRFPRNIIEEEPVITCNIDPPPIETGTIFPLSYQKWEYKRQLLAAPHVYHGVLDKMGREGWELVSVIWQSNQEVGYFKRPLKEDNNG